MPITRELTEDELLDLAKKGLNPDHYRGRQVTLDTPEEMAQPEQAPLTPQPKPEIGKLSTIGRTLAAHAGGIAGGGAAALTTAAILGAPETFGGSLLMLPLIAGAGLGGSYLGQKGQQKLLGDETQSSLEQKAQEAAQENPVTSTATDITASALASGGSFKPSNLPKAGRAIASALARKGVEGADKSALQSVLLNAAINPAVNTGIDYAATGEVPSGKDLLYQSIGGALFSGQSRLGRLGHSNVEPNAEPTVKGSTQTEGDITTSPFTEKAEDGQYKISNADVKSAYSTVNPQPNTEGMADIDRYKAMAVWKARMRQGVDQQRNELHEAFQKNIGQPEVETKTTEPSVETTAKVQPPVTTPPETTRKTWYDYLSDSELKGYNAAAERGDTGVINQFKALAQARKQNPTVQSTQPAPATETPSSGTGKTLEDIQKLNDYQKMQQEKQAQDVAAQSAQMEAGKDKPVSQNTLKIVKDSLLPDSIEREEGGRKLYEPQSDLEQYRQLANEINVLVRSGKVGTPEFKEKWQGLETIKNRNGGNPPEGWIPYPLPQPSNEVLAKIGGPNRTVKNGEIHSTVIHELSTMHDDSEWGPLAKHLSSIMDERSLSTPVIYIPKNIRGHYDIPNNVGIANPDSIKASLNRIDDNHFRIHEIAHAATSMKLPPEWSKLKGPELKAAMDKYLADGKNSAVKELIEAYYETAKSFGAEDSLFGPKGKASGTRADDAQKQFIKEGGQAMSSHGYAMGNLHEFIAGVLSDKKFQEHLNTIPSGKDKTIWTKIVEAVQKLLGIKADEGSLLARALKPTEELIAQQRPTIVPEQSFGFKANAPDDSRLKKATKPMVESVKDINHPAAVLVGNAFHKVLNKSEELAGQWQGKSMNVARKEGITPYSPEDQRLTAAMRYERENGANDGEKMLKSPEEKKVWEAYKSARDAANQHSIDIGEPIIRSVEGKKTLDSRKPEDSKWPTMTNPLVAEAYRNHKNTTAQDTAFLDYQQKLGYSVPEAQDNLTNWKKSIQGNTQGANNRTYFEATRKEMETPLPPEFTRPSFLKNMESFFHRKAMDNAYYEHVESQDKVMEGLGEKRGAWNRPLSPPDEGIAGNPHVRTQLEEFRGNLAGHLGEHTEKALSSIATTMFIGPGTTVHKVLSNTVGMLPLIDNPYAAGKMLNGMLTKASQGIEHSIENGITKVSARSVNDLFQGNLSFAERLQALAHTIRGVYSAGDLVDRWGNGLMQAGVEQLIPLKIDRANKGDRSNQDLLKRLDPDYTIGKTYTPQEMSKLSSKLVSTITGTGDGRTMPTWMSGDSELSGFFKLSHWGIGQTNRFMSDILGPAKHGNYTPLLIHLFGSAIGGYLIKDLREKIQGKRGQIPSLQEIGASEKGLSGNVPLAAYNLMASLSYAGFGGMLTQFGKIPFDRIYKNRSQGATFPLDEAASDLIETLGKASTAIANDPNLNWLELTTHVIGHLATSNFQLGRTLYNQAIDKGLIIGSLADKKELSDKLSQLRRFDMVSGVPYNEEDEAGNPYTNLEQKKFKMAQKPEEIISELPKLIAGYMDKYSDKPDLLMSKIKALKQNQYSTFPSIEEMPIEFMHYLGYLEKLKGPAQAQEELQDFLKHKVLNQVKSSVVP